MDYSIVSFFLRRLSIFLGGFLVACLLYYLNQLMLFGVGLFVVVMFCLWQQRWQFVVVLLLGVMLAGGRIVLYEHVGEFSVLKYPETTVEFIGEVCREVDYRRDKIQYTFCLISDDVTKEVVQGKLLVVGPLYPRFSMGDTVRVRGRLAIPKAIEEFRYDHYLHRFGIGRVMYRPVMSLVEAGTGFWYRFFGVKRWFLGKINQLYHEPYASFLAGLLVGYRGGLAPDLVEEFRLTGLTHIIAISGSNVALVLVILERFLLFVPKKLRLLFLLSGLALFCVFVGLSASVIRATIMGSLILVGRYYGRDIDIIVVLLVTAFGMAMIVPSILAYDAGFQLSFLAVLGILVFGPILMKRFSFLERWPLIREALVMTLAAQIGTLPLSLYLFRIFPVHAVLVNILVAPLLPLCMGLGFVSVFVWLVFGFWPLGIFVSLLLEIIVVVVGWFAKLDFLVWEFEKTTAVILAALTLVVIGGVAIKICSRECG